MAGLDREARHELERQLAETVQPDDWRANAVLMRHVFGRDGFASSGALLWRAFNDHELFFDPRDDKIGLTLLSGRPWQRHLVERSLARLADHRPDTVGKGLIDAGANIGTTLIYFMTSGRFAFADAFEPDTRNAEILIKNIEINNMGSNVQVVRALLGLVAGEGTLFRDPKNMGAHRVGGAGLPLPKASSESTIIKQTTIDSHIAERGRTPDAYGLVKIDVEGAELDVLSGMSALREARVPILVEVSGLAEDDDRLYAFKQLIDGYQAVTDVSADEPTTVSPNDFVPSSGQQDLLIY